MRNLYSFVERIMREYPIAFAATLILMTLVGILEGVGITMMVPLLNVVVVQEGNSQGEVLDSISRLFMSAANMLGVRTSLFSVLAFIFLVLVVQSVIKLAENVWVARLHVRFHGDLITKLHRAYFDASWPYFYRATLGDLINPITVEADRAASALQFVARMLSGVFIVLSYVSVALLVSWQLTIGALIVGLLVSTSLRRLTRLAEEYGIATTTANSALQAQVVDKLSAAKMLKASATEEYANRLIQKAVRENLKYRFKSLVNASLVPAFYYPASIGIVCAAIYLSFTYLDISFSAIVLFLIVFYRLMPRFSAVQTSYQQAVTFMPGLAEIDRKLAETTRYRETAGGYAFESLTDSIEFVNVTFSYNGDAAHMPTLRDINLTIARGKVTAIVGGSGGGKSTLVDLILGLLRPQAGEILVDSHPLDDLDKRSWRRAIGYVSQEIILLNDTARNNIAWSCPDASLERIENAARLAYAHDFVINLRRGYDTQIGDRGVRLSGGQRQRICLARAILQNPQILILDEATSALDSESEQMIQAAVETLSGSTTVVMISHRLSTVRTADYMYVLEDGTIVEHGTWDELVSADSRLEQLRKLQVLQ